MCKKTKIKLDNIVVENKKFTRNETLYHEALEAINRLFSDKTVSIDQCVENLNSLIQEIEMKIDCLD